MTLDIERSREKTTTSITTHMYSPYVSPYTKGPLAGGPRQGRQRHHGPPLVQHVACKKAY